MYILQYTFNGEERQCIFSHSGDAKNFIDVVLNSLPDHYVLISHNLPVDED